MLAGIKCVFLYSCPKCSCSRNLSLIDVPAVLSPLDLSLNSNFLEKTRLVYSVAFSKAPNFANGSSNPATCDEPTYHDYQTQWNQLFSQDNTDASAESFLVAAKTAAAVAPCLRKNPHPCCGFWTRQLSRHLGTVLKIMRYSQAGITIKKRNNNTPL